jgi:HEAT repeat protein
MLSKYSGKTAVCFFLLALLPNVSLATADERPCPGRRPCTDPEKDLLAWLGLREDANDTEVLQLLDIPEKQIIVSAVVSYRKTYSAVPKLLQIVNDPNTLLPVQIAAADSLCSLGNKEWMPTIKTLSLDPNGPIRGTYLAIKVAGMLARAGDYSQFETVAAWVADGKRYGRLSAICELANFRHKTDPVTDAAVDILVSVADTDPEPSFRQWAIYSLQKIAKEKPQIIPKLIDLGITSPVLLKIYELKRNEEESKQP